MRTEIILDWASRHNIVISAEQWTMLAAYQERVLAVNKYMNLTAITSEEDFAVKHFVDSMTLLPYIPEGADVIDIGSGAGFPGMVLAILRPDLRFTLLDSLRKRILFLRETVDMLGLQNVECIHTRAEEWARTGTRYSVCTARAVAGMDKLAGWALPLVQPGGVFLAMKGPDVSDELEKAKPAIAKYGGIIKRVDTVEIADGVGRAIIEISKGEKL